MYFLTGTSLTKGPRRQSKEFGGVGEEGGRSKRLPAGFIISLHQQHLDDVFVPGSDELLLKAPAIRQRPSSAHCRPPPAVLICTRTPVRAKLKALKRRRVWQLWRTDGCCLSPRRRVTSASFLCHFLLSQTGNFTAVDQQWNSQASNHPVQLFSILSVLATLLTYLSNTNKERVKLVEPLPGSTRWCCVPFMLEVRTGNDIKAELSVFQLRSRKTEMFWDRSTRPLLAIVSTGCVGVHI